MERARTLVNPDLAPYNIFAAGVRAYDPDERTATWYMRYSKVFGKTHREAPHNVRSISQIRLTQGGYIRSLGHGLYSYLPMGNIVFDRLKAVIKEEMDGLGGQEVRVPLVNPYSIWRRGGRLDYVDRDMIRFEDRTGRRLVLSPSHEEAMVELVRRGIDSYRDLPIFLYQFQAKFRDEARVRSGLIRAKEFVMKDAYSFHRTYYDLNNFFPRVFAAYRRIFERCGVPVISAESGVGYMGGEKAYEFLMPSDNGDDRILVCDSCGYRANAEIAKSIKEVRHEEPQNTEPVQTGMPTRMASLSESLGVPRSRLAKSLVYRTGRGLVMAVVRGDYEISVEKLAGVLRTPVLSLATDRELEAAGLSAGNVSPLGVSGVKVIADDAVAKTPNLVFGANIDGSHVLNVNVGRDFVPDVMADIAQANEGDRCLQCHGTLRQTRAIELGNIFKLRDFYSRAMDLSFQADNGERAHPHMGSYGIGMGRLISAVVEANADGNGFVWPDQLTPFGAYLMGIGASPAVHRIVEKLHDAFPSHMLLDDRHESPGVKFKDMDLLGIPLRVVVGPKALADGNVELYDRRLNRTTAVPVDAVESMLADRWKARRSSGRDSGASE